MSTYSTVQALLNGAIWICYATPFVLFLFYMIDVFTREDFAVQPSNSRQEGSLAVSEEDLKGILDSNQSTSSHAITASQADDKRFKDETKPTLDFSKFSNVRRVQKKGSPIILADALEGSHVDLSGLEVVIHPLGEGYLLKDLGERFTLLHVPRPTAKERRTEQPPRRSRGFQHK